MFLRKYLDDFYFDMVMNNYDISYLESIDEDNFEKIYCLLKMYNFYYINDIILNYIEIFSLDIYDVKNGIIELRNKLGSNYVYIIGNDMRYLDCLLNN